MGVKPINLRAFALACALAAPTAAFATNGYFLTGYGAKAIALGGAGTAFPQDALASAANAAGIVYVNNRFDIGVGIFNPPRRVNVDSRGSFFGDNTGEARSKGDWFLVPNMGFVSHISSDLAWGIAVFGNGLGDKFEPNFYKFNNRASDVIGVELMQVLMPITLAFKDDDQAFGASLVLGRQRFRARGLGSFAPVSSDPDHMTDMGNDYGKGAGYQVGWSGKYLDDRLTLGAAYASKVYMSRFKSYEGLFADKGNFDVPAHYSIGLAYKWTKETTVVFDINRINYSNIRSVGNNGPSLLTGDPIGTASSANSKIGALGRSDGMGFGWHDQIIYKLGFEYNLYNIAQFRLGFNYGKTPIPPENYAFNVLAPATVEKHISFGATVDLGKDPVFGFGKSSEVTATYLHAFRKKLSGRSALGTNQVTGQGYDGTAEMEMKQNELEFSLGIRF